MVLLFVLYAVSVVESEPYLFTQAYIWPDKHLEKHVHLEAVFKPSPGLRLLVKCVLLVPPCYEEMKKQGLSTRLRLSWRRGPDLMHSDRLRCVFGAHLVVSSSCRLLSAGFPALLGRAWNQNCPRRKNSIVVTHI